jgi:oleate hydratase
MEDHFECLCDLYRSIPSLEMKLYLHRFIRQITGMLDFSTLKFTKYNQYESLVLPLVKWLQGHGVVFQCGTEVTDVDFNIAPGRKQATRIYWLHGGVEGGVSLGADDMVFLTNGSLTKNSDNGDHHTPAKLQQGPAPASLWHGNSPISPGPQRRAGCALADPLELRPP